MAEVSVEEAPVAEGAVEEGMGGVVIVGAGHAGTQLAASLREAGYEGRVTLLSDEPDAPYHKPPLSKSFMKTADAELQPLRGPDFFRARDIDLRLGASVREIDRERREVVLGDETLFYERLVLATGTRARRLQVPGADAPNVFHLRSATDARRMRDGLPALGREGRAVVIGAGFIGLEAAAMLRARGLDVTVVETAPRPLGRAVSPQTAAAVRERLEGEGVALLFERGVERLEDGAVVLADGTRLPADLVVVGIGAVPDTALAEAAGLPVDDGIVVDGGFRTADPHVFAIGDCVRFPQRHLKALARLESVQNATDGARALAARLAGTDVPDYGALPWFWSDIGDLKLQIAGLGQGADEDVAVRSADGALRSVWRLRDGRPVAVETLNSAGEHMLARRLLEGGMAPPRAMIERGDVAELKNFLRGG